jgi:hypothetical protein
VEGRIQSEGVGLGRGKGRGRGRSLQEGARLIREGRSEEEVGLTTLLDN